MAVASDLPSELVTRPLSLVALSGLDITNNVAHSRIWESFTSNRLHDRISLTFKLVPFDHQFPKCKPKVIIFNLCCMLRRLFERFMSRIQLCRGRTMTGTCPKGFLSPSGCTNI